MHALDTTETLLSRCVAGEAPARRQLHQLLYPPAAAFLRQMGVASEDLDDVAQDVFVQVFRYLPTFQGRAELKTWVYKICSSQATRLRRKHAMRRMLRRLTGATPSPAPTIDVEGGGLEARRAIEAALGQMSDRQREVFVLYELHGVPGAEIAQIVGCPAATVRGRLREARQIFGRVLGDDAPDLGEHEKERKGP